MPGLGHPVAARLARGEGDAEVGHQRSAVVHQDVLGLDVAVDHAVPVGVVQRRGDLGGDPDRVGHGELLLPVEPAPERLPLDEGHDVEEEAVGLARVEQRQDVRVLEVGGELDLGQEPLGADHGRELRAQQLERDLAVVLQVLREVHRRHAAGADLTFDPVAVGERYLEAVLQLGHGGLWWGLAERCPRFGRLASDSPCLTAAVPTPILGSRGHPAFAVSRRSRRFSIAGGPSWHKQPRFPPRRSSRPPRL